MTSDAKIGLLLGLVFIFIIAFIINGLPNFHNKTDSNELTQNMVSKELGIGGGGRKITREVINPVQDTEKQTSDQGTTTSQDTQNTVTSTNLTAAKAAIETAPSVKETIAAKPVVTEPQTRPVDSVKPAAAVETTVKASAPPVTTRTIAKTAEPVSSRTYVVIDGDNLTKIAAKVYGTEESKKKSNVDRLFEANRQTIKSESQLYVGQKLIIPPLPASERIAKQTEDKDLPSTMFERVNSMGTRRTANTALVAGAESTKNISVPKLSESKMSNTLTKVPAANTKKTTALIKKYKQYVVREGDNLWRIASNMLGDGKRFNEIKQLNSDIETNNLAVGTVLKVPAK